MRPLEIDPFPGAPRFVLGVSVIRGLTVPVVDAGALLDESSPTRTRRLVLLRAGARRVALAVEAVLDVRRLPKTTTAELPPLLASSRADVVDALGTLDHELFVLLRSAQLVPDAVWTALDRKEATP